MKRAEHVIDHAARLNDSPHVEPPRKPSANVMDRLWTVMLQIFGHQFESSFGTEPSDQWAQVLAGITPAMMSAGLERMKTSEQFRKWPPNALAFRSLCLPREEDFGLPSLGEAFQQAVGNRPGERHPAVIATLQRIDGYALRQMSNENALRAFTPAWQETVQRVANGEPLPERQERLASGVAVNTNRDKDAAREHMALIREMLN